MYKNLFLIFFSAFKKFVLVWYSIRGEKIKNILRSFEPENGQNLKNTQAEIQISWSYEKKRVNSILW